MPKRKFAKTGKTVFSGTKRRRVTTKRAIAPPRTGGFWGVTARTGDERKFTDTIDGSDVSSAGQVTPVNLVATGTDFNNRIGRKIIIKSFQVRSIFTLEDPTEPNAIRCMLVYDKQTNGNLPGIADILDTATAANAQAAMVNLNNRDRFVILMDKIYRLNIGAQTNMVFKKYKKLNHETVYSGTTAAIGSIATGGLYWVTLGNRAAGVVDVDQASTCRIRFVDA